MFQENNFSLTLRGIAKLLDKKSARSSCIVQMYNFRMAPYNNLECDISDGNQSATALFCQNYGAPLFALRNPIIVIKKHRAWGQSKIGVDECQLLCEYLDVIGTPTATRLYIMPQYPMQPPLQLIKIQRTSGITLQFFKQFNPDSYLRIQIYFMKFRQIFRIFSPRYSIRLDPYNATIRPPINLQPNRIIFIGQLREGHWNGKIHVKVTDKSYFQHIIQGIPIKSLYLQLMDERGCRIICQCQNRLAERNRDIFQEGHSYSIANGIVKLDSQNRIKNSQMSFYKILLIEQTSIVHLANFQPLPAEEQYEIPFQVIVNQQKFSQEVDIYGILIRMSEKINIGQNSVRVLTIGDRQMTINSHVFLWNERIQEQELINLINKVILLTRFVLDTHDGSVFFTASKWSSVKIYHPYANEQQVWNPQGTWERAMDYPKRKKTQLWPYYE